MNMGVPFAMVMVATAASAQDGIVHTWYGFVPNGERSGFVQDGDFFERSGRGTSGSEAETVPRRAPEYFVRTAMATTTAERVAELCPSLGFDAAAAEARSNEILARLAEDGFDTDNLAQSMADPGDQVRALQNAFIGRHGLVRMGSSDRLVCDAGLAEINDGSEMGSFLYVLSAKGAADPSATGAD